MKTVLQSSVDETGQALIPEDLQGALAELDKVLPQSLKADIAARGSEGQHFALGEWIRNTWGLWGMGNTERDLALRKYFLLRGLTRADEMSRSVIEAYQFHLRGEPVIELPLLVGEDLQRALTRIAIPEFLRKYPD